MSIQMAGVARGEENAVKNGFGIHCALVPGENLGGTVTAILPLFVREVASAHCSRSRRIGERPAALPRSAPGRTSRRPFFGQY